jgi:hypothetical protein
VLLPGACCSHLSNGVSNEREGDELTSSTQTEPDVSISTSNPNSSKALTHGGMASCADTVESLALVVSG